MRDQRSSGCREPIGLSLGEKSDNAPDGCMMSQPYGGSAILQAASSATATVLDMIATGKAEGETGIFIVHTVPFSELRLAIPLTCSTRRRTNPSPCRLLSALALNPLPSSLMIMVS